MNDEKKKRKRGRPKGLKSLTPRWGNKIRRFVTNNLATWARPTDLYKELIGPGFLETHGFGGLDPDVHAYGLFMDRCRKIPRTELIEAREEWEATLTDVRWAGMKDRAKALSDLIDTVMKRIEKSDGEDTIHEGGKGHVTVQTIHEDVTQIRMLMEQVRKEVSADADRAALSASGGRVLIANPKAVEITAETVSEMLLIYREELGGLHNMNLVALTLTELEKLLEATQKAIFNKIQSMNETNITDGEDDGD